MDIRGETETSIVLAPHTTLGIGGPAAFWRTVTSLEEVRACDAFCREHTLPLFVLGGGSNVLFSDEGFRGLVMEMCLRGVTYETITETAVRVVAHAGESFDALVERTVHDGLWGLENLSGIPGTVGAVPIQNVGAYGVEAKDIIESVTVYDRERDSVYDLSHEECRFGYRDSLFKHEGGRSLIVLGVTFLLSKNAHPQLAYRDLHNVFSHVPLPELSAIRNMVLFIRSTKFPDWHTMGTAGSFFKNPLITEAHYKKLKAHYPELPGYVQPDTRVKIPLGWVLDHVLNLRGYREGNVGLYEKQALVLVRHGEATSSAIRLFAEHIVRMVHDKTEIVVEYEVVFV